jgi:hypothetical protein
MSKVLEIGDYSHDGLLQITDTAWDSNGTLRVTVREMIGGIDGWVLPKRLVIARMRRLARRALPEYHKGQTRSSRLLSEVYAQGCTWVTFAVSRNEEY